MAREHARIWLDINADDDFEALPFDAQGLYTRVILTLDDLSYCGVADWRPKRLTTKAPDLTVDRIMDAAAALEDGLFLMFDLTTEEVLARSFIRRDELLRNPKFAAAVVKAYAGIASKVLRAAVVTEVRRVRDEHPEYSSWTAKDKTTDIGEALAKLMAKPGLDEVAYVNQIANPITDDITNGITNEIGNRIGNTGSVPITNPVGNRIGNGIPSTYTSTPTPAPLEGYVSTEGHQADTTAQPTTRPPDRCTRHTNTAAPPACRACGDARTKAETWDRDQAAITARATLARRSEIRNCPDCDENGWVQTDAGVTRCTNHTWETTNA